MLPVSLKIFLLFFRTVFPPPGVSSLRCLYSPTRIFLLSPLPPRKSSFPPVLTSSGGVPHTPDPQGSPPPPWSGCRWSCPMVQHTPSQTPTLGRSISSRWRPRTTRSGRGVTGAWPPMPRPGLRNLDTSPLRPRPRVSPPPPPVLPAGLHSCLVLSCFLQLLLGLGASAAGGLHTLCGCHTPVHLSSPCCFSSFLSGHSW